jgi:hypothetical protein
VKLTIPMAYSTAMLAWGLLEFPAGYKKANQTLHAMDTLRWSTDYLLKTFVRDKKHVGGTTVHYNIVYQVGPMCTTTSCIRWAPCALQLVYQVGPMCTTTSCIRWAPCALQQTVCLSRT